jgi:hypothetical protein
MSCERHPDLRRDRGSASALSQYSVVTDVTHRRTLAPSRPLGRQVRSHAATNRCQPRPERLRRDDTSAPPPAAGAYFG